MGKISDAVNYALAQQGKPYHAYGARFGPDYFDCSGLMNACLNNTGTPCSATNTVGFYNWGKQTGKLISVDAAKRTYGAMLIKGRWYGYGPLGHIGISLGDGRSMEAVGRRLGCRIMDVNATGWHDGLIVPGADYGPTTPPPPKVKPQMSQQLNARLYNKETHGWFEGYSNGRVDYLAPDGNVVHGGMVLADGSPDPNFAGRTLATLEERWYARRSDGKHVFGFTIRSTSNETYVPANQH